MANNKAYLFLLISSLTIFSVDECFGFGLANDPLGTSMMRRWFFSYKSSSVPAEKYTASLVVDTEHSPESIIDTKHSPEYAASLTVDTEHSPRLTVDTEHSPVYMGPQDGLKEADKIEALPGQPKHGGSFDQYSGYVTVDAEHGRALFYYFVESPQNSSTNPLVLWLNGGPGCSSFGNGAMMELGPFRVKPNGKSLYINEYSWINVANVIFLESPAGVGFSYSNTTTDYKLQGDNITAQDSYTFLVNWLERFPEYKTRDFYITGENYAGHYAPQLAQLILKKNKITNQTAINLKGIAIGNAEIDFETQLKGMYDFLWNRALISDELYQKILLNCNFSLPITEKCVNGIDEIPTSIGQIDINNIDAPLCSSTTTTASKKKKFTADVSIFDPCTGKYTSHYLNIPKAQKALHANVTAIPHPWKLCREMMLSKDVHYQDSPETMLPMIKELMNNGISVWVYSGDTDFQVPVTATRYAINKMAIPVQTKWYPWYNQKEVGGYVVRYENLTFVTVRGGGLSVPSYQPARALTLFKSFLEGKLPPAS